MRSEKEVGAYELLEWCTFPKSYLNCRVLDWLHWRETRFLSLPCYTATKAEVV